MGTTNSITAVLQLPYVLALFRKAKKRAKTEGAKEFRGVTFAGAECVRFLTHFDEFVDSVSTSLEEAELAKTVCDQWLAVWNVIRFRVPYNQRLFKARAVEQTGRIFVTSLIGWATPESVHYYGHALVCHLPEQIKTCPVDIMDASGSGIEQINQEVKRLIR